MTKFLYSLSALSILVVSCNYHHTGTAKDSENKTMEKIMPIKSNEYLRFFVVKDVTETYLLDKIKEYGELNGTDSIIPFNFDFTTYNSWKIVRVDKSLSFYKYHNLIMWFHGVEEDKKPAEISLGLAIHESDSSKTYVCYADPKNESGDTEIGVFASGDNFKIYLPDAYEEKGNLTVTSTKLSRYTDVNSLLNSYDLSLSLFKSDSLRFIAKKIGMNSE